ncbi:hypothetical protein GX48_01482 [Paracoccidioides brasiliensis]|nr:hypothetical protein GX48_01482 [Paracoccidioides brasiliensis]
MEFLVGWARLQLILYTQLAAVTGNWLDALTQLRYHDLVLTLVRDPHSGTPRLCVVLITHFTKAFLGMKDVNTFRLPEIIYDPTLVLSPHVFLGMLFHIEVFKSPSLKTPEQLYSLRILDRLNQQELPLRDDLANKFIFCMVVREGDGVRIAHERQLTTSLLRNCMKRGGKITGLDQVMKLYVLRDGAAKAFNKSREYPPVLPFPLAAPILSPLTTSGHLLWPQAAEGADEDAVLNEPVHQPPPTLEADAGVVKISEPLPHIPRISRRVECLKKCRYSATSWLRGRISSLILANGGGMSIRKTKRNKTINAEGVTAVKEWGGRSKWHKLHHQLLRNNC